MLGKHSVETDHVLISDYVPERYTQNPIGGIKLEAKRRGRVSGFHVLFAKMMPSVNAHCNKLEGHWHSGCNKFGWAACGDASALGCFSSGS
jgi:hypothetical protein